MFNRGLWSCATEETEIKITDVVPGDIVLMQAGSIVPADVRLLVAKDFFVSQSSLTGESMPVEKTAEIKLSGPEPGNWPTPVISAAA